MISQEIARGSIGKTKKILQTLSDNSNQTILYKLLQMYVKMGLKVKKVHCVVKFEQEAWLEQDITLNTTKRQQARNKFEKDLYKTFKKLCLWEKCDSNRNRMLFHIVRHYQAALRKISTSEFNSYKTFGENLAAFPSNPKNNYCDVPTIMGASGLELTKCPMYKKNRKIILCI